MCSLLKSLSICCNNVSAISSAASLRRARLRVLRTKLYKMLLDYFVAFIVPHMQ